MAANTIPLPIPSVQSRQADFLHCTLFVILFGLLANIPFWAATRVGGFITIGRFCIEYVLVGVLALFVPRWLTAILLFLAIAGDVLSGISHTYSVSPLDCLSNGSFIAAFNPTRLRDLLAVLTSMLLVVTAAAFYPRKKIALRTRLQAALCIAGLLAAGLGTDYLTVAKLTGRFPNPFRQLPPTDGVKAEIRPERIFRRPSIQLFQAQIVFGETERVELANVFNGAQVSNASQVAFEALRHVAQQRGKGLPNLVLILTESSGVVNDSGLRSSLVQPYMRPDILARYQVVQGEVPFHGSTVAGESRELCGQDFGFGILSESQQAFRRCLPDQLKALGYHDIAAHGNSGYFFRRVDWYNRIGFDEQRFRSYFHDQGLPDCVGTVLGTCDAAIAQWIGKRLDTPQANPDFIYWVTLNSHLPLPIPAPGDFASKPYCSAAPLLSTYPAFCSWYQLIANVHRSVAAVAAEDSPRPTIFVIVGDHAPPFGEPILRGLFSRTTVPYVVLIPRVRSSS